MKQQRTSEAKESIVERPLPLIVVTAVSYLVAAGIALSPAGRADTSSASAPAPYSEDHARITNEEAQPPTF